MEVENEQNKRDVEETLTELFGRRYRVRCVLAQGGSVSDAPQPASEVKAASTQQVPVSEKPDMIDDPVVRAAVEDLGAVVRH